MPAETGKSQNSKSEIKNEDRFYYIRVKEISDISPRLLDESLKTSNMKLSFEISTKKS